MKFLSILACVFLTSCAHTVVKDAQGRTRFRTYGNVQKLEYHEGNTKLVMTKLNHSLPTAATGKAISGVTGSIGSIITAGGAGILIP
jgi:hypothetical protein